MQADHQEDLDFAAENRRRRRMGQEPLTPPEWPTERFNAADFEVTRVTLENRDIATAHYAVEIAKLFCLEPKSPGEQARAEEAGEKLLADLRAFIARARGTREPGAEG